MADLLPFTLTNSDGSGPVLAAGADATLVLTVVNRTGADLQLVAGTSQLALKLPKTLFTHSQLTAMHATGIGWSGTGAPDGTLNIKSTANETWSQAASVTITIAPVRSDAAPQTQTIYLVPTVTGNAPLGVESSLTVAGSSSSKLPLQASLAATLSNSGIVYRSSASDPLVNTLVLNLKNTTTEALASSPSRVGSPTVEISFVYGTSSGALAPAQWDPNQPAPADSAWKIHAGLGPAETAWVVQNPPKSDGCTSPTWTLTPISTNMMLLGPRTSDTANVTVEFSQIRSFTESGHTQMIVLCTGFAKDAQTAYADAVFVLDLDKIDPPATRGIVAFSGRTPNVVITDPNQAIAVPLRWTMFEGVASVVLSTSTPLVAPVTRSYPNPAGLVSDAMTLSIPAPPTDEAVFLTLQAFDGNGTFLNQAQFTISIRTTYLCDAIGNVYPIARFGDRLWMTADYRCDVGAGVSVFPDQSASDGMLYTWSAARRSAPDGWTLPNDEDWKALVSDPRWSSPPNPPNAPYVALRPGGESGFNVALGGQFVPGAEPKYQFHGEIGFYWTATPNVVMQVLRESQAIVELGTPEPTAQAAVRYVRRI